MEVVFANWEEIEVIYDPIMADTKPIACASCGFAKNAPNAERCASCGAKLEAVTKAAQTAEDAERRYSQEGINVKWMGISLLVQAVLTGAIIFGLPKVVPMIDFEGGNGMVLCIPLWAAGGFLVGMISPGRTFIEPVIASLGVAIPSTLLLIQNQTVRTMPTFLYVIMSSIGILFTLIGAYMGERVQMGAPPKKA